MWFGTDAEHPQFGVLARIDAFLLHHLKNT